MRSSVVETPAKAQMIPSPPTEIADHLHNLSLFFRPLFVSGVLRLKFDLIHTTSGGGPDAFV